MSKFGESAPALVKKDSFSVSVVSSNIVFLITPLVTQPKQKKGFQSVGAWLGT